MKLSCKPSVIFVYSVYEKDEVLMAVGITAVSNILIFVCILFLEIKIVSKKKNYFKTDNIATLPRVMKWVSYLNLQIANTMKVIIRSLKGIRDRPVHF